MLVLEKYFKLIRTTIVILSFLAFNFSAKADILGDLTSAYNTVAACLTDVCNCGQTAQSNETWNGITTTNTLNKNCPPYNKDTGRNGCILKFTYPGAWIFSYVATCAESSSSGTYFSPKIHVRNQTCNGLACWGLDKDLGWDGECVNWPGITGYPLIRVCARIAVGYNTLYTPPAPDDGYTLGVHLNSEGATTNDDPIIIKTLLNGTVTTSALVVNADNMMFALPKLCAYNDPSIFSDPTSVDLFDINPRKQNIHFSSGGISPIAKILIFVMKMGDMVNIYQLINTILSTLPSSVPGMDITSSIFRSISGLVEYVGDSFAKLLTEYGQFNRIVYQRLGCVPISFGPMPPYYCPILSDYPPVPTVQAICQTTNGVPALSTIGNECVRSTARNNFIYNSVRTSFDVLIPLCSSDITTNCVQLVTSPLSSNIPIASFLHAQSLNGIDTLANCSVTSSTSGSYCASILSANSYTGASFRIVYALVQGSDITPINYYINGLQDCSTATTSGTCIKVWGINVGQFTDQSVVFLNLVNQSNPITPLSTSFSIIDPKSNTQNFYASISRQFPNSKNQPTNQICIYDANSDVSIGCVSRQQLPSRPSLYDCSAFPSYNCNTNYYIPQFIAQLAADTDTTSVVVEPSNISDQHVPPQYPGSINLAGATFDSFVTDDTVPIKIRPFSGSNSMNNTSIYGNYTNGAPYSVSGTTITMNNNTQFLNGLEYINNLYIEGGTFACLTPTNLLHCPADTTMCVLSNLLNSNIVDCANFNNTILPQYPNLIVCPSSSNYANTIATILGKSSVANNLTIYGNGTGCTTSAPSNCTSYCYNNNSNNLANAVCQVSTALADRLYPTQAQGNPLNSSQYYDINHPVGGATTIVDCTDFSSKVSLYSGLSLCTTPPAQATQIDTIAPYTPTPPATTPVGSSLPVYQYPLASSSYCYSSNTNSYCYASSINTALCASGAATSGVDCVTLNNLQSTTYSNLGMCASSSLSACSVVQQLPGTGSAPVAVNIYKCPGSASTATVCANGATTSGVDCTTFNALPYGPLNQCPSTTDLSTCTAERHVAGTGAVNPIQVDIYQCPNVAYCYGGSTNLCIKYDPTISALRDKTSVELNQCIAVPPAVCPAVTTPGAADNNATWSQANIGNLSTGTCITAFGPKSDKALTRYCVGNIAGQNAVFAALPDNVGCANTPCPVLTITIKATIALADAESYAVRNQYSTGGDDMPYMASKFNSFLQIFDQNSNLIVSFTAPVGSISNDIVTVAATFSIPAGSNFTVNLKAKSNDAQSSEDSLTSAGFTNNMLIFTGMQPGTYNFAFDSSNNSPNVTTNSDGSISMDAWVSYALNYSCQSCGAVTTPGFHDGHATWTSSPVGRNSIGTCLPGYSGSVTPRTCIRPTSGQGAILPAANDVIGCIRN